MDRFTRDVHQSDSSESRIERDDFEWCYEKRDGRWQQVSLPNLGYLDPNNYEEKDRRLRNTRTMLKDTAAQWRLNDTEVKHNEGFLRDHPRYHELFEKWAMRYLRQKGFDRGKFSGRIDESEGNLLDIKGKWSRTWLVNAIANGREWIDENAEMELRISEGFVDITHNYERREELGVEPEHQGWWTHDEI